MSVRLKHGGGVWELVAEDKRYPEVALQDTAAFR